MSDNQRRAADIIHRRTLRLGDSTARTYDRALLAARDLAEAGLIIPDGTHGEEDYRITPFQEVAGMYVTRRYIRLVTPWKLVPMITHAEKNTTPGTPDPTESDHP